MESQTKVIKQIAKDLKSKDQSVIQKALEKTRAKGNEYLIDPLVNLYTTSKDEQIKDEIKNIFSELKNNQSINYLLPYLDDNEMRKRAYPFFNLEFGIDVGDYLKEITQAVCTGNYGYFGSINCNRKFRRPIFRRRCFPGFNFVARTTL